MSRATASASAFRNVARAGRTDNHHVEAAHDGVLKDGALPGGDVAAHLVLSQGIDPRRRVADGPARREHGGLDQPLEARAVAEQLAFHEGTVARDHGVERAGDGGDQAQRLVSGHRAANGGLLAVAHDPHLAGPADLLGRVEVNVGDVRLGQDVADQRAKGVAQVVGPAVRPNCEWGVQGRASGIGRGSGTGRGW